MTKGFPWTPAEDDKLKSMAIAGDSAVEIAAALHRSASAVYARSLRFGFSLRQVKTLGSKRDSKLRTAAP
jgi:hypothetical protein